MAMPLRRFKNDLHIPNMIVAGEADLATGKYMENEENHNDWPNIIYAPGDNDAWEDLDVPGPILCAARKGDENALDQSGSSHGKSNASVFTAGWLT